MATAIEQADPSTFITDSCGGEQLTPAECRTFTAQHPPDSITPPHAPLAYTGGGIEWAWLGVMLLACGLVALITASLVRRFGS